MESVAGHDHSENGQEIAEVFGQPTSFEGIQK